MKTCGFMKVLRVNKIIVTLVSALALTGCNSSSSGNVSQCNLSVGNSIEDILYDLNPSGNAPLSASLSFLTKNPSSYKVTVNGKNPVSMKSDACETVHQLNLLGLYSNSDNRITISVNEGEVIEDLTIVTDALPDYFPEIVINQESEDASDLTLINYRPSGAPFIVDRAGDVRWYLDVQQEKYGLILLDNGNLAYGVAREDKILEYSWMGELLNTWGLGDEYSGVHHDVVEKPNGNFLATVNKVDAGTVDDHIIEIERSTGEVVKEWDLRPLLPIGRTNLFNGFYDWFHNNGLSYDPITETLLISGQRQGLIKVTENNDLFWILSQTDGYKGDNLPEYERPDYEGWDGYEQYLLNSDDPNFEFIWGQHAPLVRDNGNIMLFDNGFNRYYDGIANSTFSRVVEFRVTEAADGIGGEIEHVWSYGQSRGSEFQSRILSDVDDLGDSILMTSGSLAFDGGWNDSLVDKAKIIEIDYSTKSVLNEMTIVSQQDVIGSVYRAERLSFSDIGLIPQ